MNITQSFFFIVLFSTAYANGMNQTIGSAASSSSSSSSAINQTVQALPSMNVSGDQAQAVIVDPSELDALAQKYKTPIAVSNVPGVSAVRLTHKSLEHVFGMELKDNTGCYMSGFHYDYNLQHQNQFPVFYKSLTTTGPGIREGFIALDCHHLPTFKTFFSCALTRDQIIEKLKESLRNIVYKEEQGKRWMVEGNTFNGIKIRTVFDKATGEIVTFFPVSEKKSAEIKKETEEHQEMFKKLFFNPDKKPARSPVTDDEIKQLQAVYSDGIKVDWVLGEVDLAARSGLHPYWQSILCKKNELKAVSRQYGRMHNQRTIPKVNITIESLQSVFSPENEKSFLPHLTRLEILGMLKEALQNIEIDEIQKMKNVKASGFNGIGTFLDLRSYTTGSKSVHKRLLFILINEDTADLGIFYPLAG